MKVNEMFESIQGEGKYAGFPVLFIRLSGCSRNCEYCDSKYHNEGENIDTSDVIKKINTSKKEIVVWTGGEPLLQFKGIKKVIEATNKMHHVETNGDLLNREHLQIFDYLSISPKDFVTAHNVKELVNSNITNDSYDIKVVTDLEMGNDMIQFATMLMPLTTDDKLKNKLINQNVWNYCDENNLKFCLRQHVEVWGVKKRGV